MGEQVAIKLNCNPRGIDFTAAAKAAEEAAAADEAAAAKAAAEAKAAEESAAAQAAADARGGSSGGGGGILIRSGLPTSLAVWRCPRKPPQPAPAQVWSQVWKTSDHSLPARAAPLDFHKK